jgi:hypothetical protein
MRLKQALVAGCTAMAAEEGNKIGDMELPMSLIMLADPLLSACSWYAVRERFMRCTLLFIGRECSDIDSLTLRHGLEDTYSLVLSTTGHGWIKTLGSNAEEREEEEPAVPISRS